LPKDVVEILIKISIIFLGVSLGSAFEFETQLIICKNLQYINQDDFNFLEAEIQHIQNMIIKLKSSIEKKL
jgi:four helix bundle protein